MAERAARLAKADLVTGMVGEFPELQGVMGGYYARAEGLPSQVADAIRDHYKPVGQGDAVPTAPVTVAVSLADKLDTLTTFFFEGMEPTGSKDPFALRRSALGVLAMLLDNRLRLPLTRLFEEHVGGFAGQRVGREGAAAIEAYASAATDVGLSMDARLREREIARRTDDHAAEERFVRPATRALGRLIAFMAERLKVQQREAGVRHDLIDAVFALGGEDDLVRLLARVTALQAFVASADGANLLAGYKRAANILKKEGWDGTAPATASHDAPAPAEATLVQALEEAEPAAGQAVADERFGDAMAALALLRAPIDAFFDQVTVNDLDPAVRARRLALLARIRDAVHRVADFSRIEG